MHMLQTEPNNEIYNCTKIKVLTEIDVNVDMKFKQQ